MNRVYPISGNDAGQEWDKQHYSVNNGAPQKESLERNDIHNISHFSIVLSM